MEEIKEIKAGHMYRKVEKYIKRHEMIRKGDVVLAGVSGGGDSMAMLAMLKGYQKKLDFALGAVHVHHGIRGGDCKRKENGIRRNRADGPKGSFSKSLPGFCQGDSHAYREKCEGAYCTGA